MSNEFTYANGQRLATARRWCSFYFGVFFDKVEKNDIKKRFDIYVKDKIFDEGKVLLFSEYFDEEEFEEFWQPEFMLIIVSHRLA